MLMFFEGMLCKQRQASLMMLRSMRRAEINILVFRLGKWSYISSEDLLPGDIISLPSLYQNSPRTRLSSKEEEAELVIPCDAIIIKGTCVINEAMLTGKCIHSFTYRFYIS